MRIALLEDDPAVGELTEAWLTAAGYRCARFMTGEAFFQALRRESFDLLLIDWMLPDTSGDKVLGWVREQIDWPIPIIMVTARDSEHDIIEALTKGADDYAVKPVRRGELLARIAALLRRSSGFVTDQPVLEVPPFSIDRKVRTLSRDGKPIALTQKDFDLAAVLFEGADRVFSRGHLLEQVWGLDASAVDTRTVDTHVSRLRRKLGLNARSGWRLSAVHGYGYRLERLAAS